MTLQFSHRPPPIPVNHRPSPLVSNLGRIFGRFWPFRPFSANFGRRCRKSPVEGGCSMCLARWRRGSVAGGHVTIVVIHHQTRSKESSRQGSATKNVFVQFVGQQHVDFGLRRADMQPRPLRLFRTHSDTQAVLKTDKATFYRARRCPRGRCHAAWSKHGLGACSSNFPQ